MGAAGMLSFGLLFGGVFVAVGLVGWFVTARPPKTSPAEPEPHPAHGETGADDAA